MIKRYIIKHISKYVLVFHLIAIALLIVMMIMEKDFAERMGWFGIGIFLIGLMAIDQSFGMGSSRLMFAGKLIILISVFAFILCLIGVIASQFDSIVIYAFGLTWPFFIAAYAISAVLYFIDQKKSVQHDRQVIQ